MDMTNFLFQARRAVSSILSLLIVFSAVFGIVNPPVARFVPEDIIDVVDNSPQITLADAGQSGYVIVKGVHAAKSEKTAASKLQSYLKKISGVELQIVTDAAPARDKEIIVGKTSREGAGYTVDRAALGDDGFVIKTIGTKLIIAGGEIRGTLYGVFDFLEKFLGCAWLSSDITIVPEKTAVLVPAVIDEVEIPAFSCRAATNCYPKTLVSADYCLANRVNSLAPAVESEELGGMLKYTPSHNAAAIMPVSVYFADHPEYYALTESGVRDTGNPCLSNEAVIKIFSDYAVNSVKADPNQQAVTICLNDSGALCQCDRCKAIYAGEGGANSGTLIRLLNAVSDEMTKINPAVKLVTLGYGVSVEPPVTRLRDNIIVYFCPISMCFAHTLEMCTYSESKLLCEQLKGWGKVCKNIFIFEYPVNYNMYTQPYPVWDSLQPNIKYYYENNVRGLYICCNAYCDGNFYVMNSWLYEKLLWDPYADMELLEQEFMSLYFGDGWQYIKEYMRLISSDECSGKTIAGIQRHMLCTEDVTGPCFLAMTKNQIKYCSELWEKAKSMAKEDWQLDNIRSSEISWRVWKACTHTGEFTRLQAPGVWTLNNKKLFADMQELGVTQFSQDDPFVTQEEFNKLSLDYLDPYYWTWRKLGRDKQATANSFWDLVFSWISEVKLFV